MPLYTTALGWFFLWDSITVSTEDPFHQALGSLDVLHFYLQNKLLFPEVLSSDEMDMEMHCSALPSGKDLLPKLLYVLLVESLQLSSGILSGFLAWGSTQLMTDGGSRVMV